MASLQQLQALKQSLMTQINTAFAPLLTEAAPAAGDEEAEHEETKLTPRQKLEKQLETATEKLTKLNEKIAGGKSKIPDKDKENQAKFEEVISKINEKISELDAKEAKKAEPKPTKAKANKAEKPEAEKPKAAEEKSEVKKHVPRITPAMTTQLKDAMESASAPWDDKYKKEFVTEVNALSDKEFGAMTLEGHMAHFASKHTPASVGGGGSAAAAPKLKTLTVAELVKQNKNLTQVSPGIFRHTTTGEMVTGPAEDSDEEFEDQEHDGDDYIVGQSTKRVYKTSADGPDEFVGYWGVGAW